MPNPPDIAAVTFVVDENLLGLARSLTGLRSDIAVVGERPIAELLPRGVLDPQWIPIVGDRDWIMITNDHGIRTRPVEAQLARTHNLKVVHLQGKVGRRPAWDQAVRLLSRWEAVERNAATPGPWWLSLQSSKSRLLTYSPGEVARSS